MVAPLQTSGLQFYAMPRSTDHARYFNAVSQQSLAASSIATYRAGETSSITRDKIEKLLGASGGNLAYAGYPYDPFALDT